MGHGIGVVWKRVSILAKQRALEIPMSSCVREEPALQSSSTTVQDDKAIRTKKLPEREVGSCKVKRTRYEEQNVFKSFMEEDTCLGRDPSKLCYAPHSRNSISRPNPGLKIMKMQHDQQSHGVQFVHNE